MAGSLLQMLTEYARVATTCIGCTTLWGVSIPGCCKKIQSSRWPGRASSEQHGGLHNDLGGAGGRPLGRDSAGLSAKSVPVGDQPLSGGCVGDQHIQPA